MLELDKVTRGQFEAVLDGQFVLVHAAGEIPLQLKEVRSLGAAYPGALREPFALEFRSALAFRLPQGMYRLKHESLGEFELFLVQLAPRDGASCLEAIFT